jgi:RNase H-like domain found in reverse transcriptase
MSTRIYKMKATMANDAFLRYPDHNKPFHIYCDASDLQLGAIITQEGAPVAFYSCKLNRAQQHYTIGEEIFCIVETLQEYCTMLYKNNTFNNLQTQHILCWWLFLEDYAVKFCCITGESNSLADALSCLPFDERQNPPDCHNHPSNLYDAAVQTQNTQKLKSFTLLANNDDLIDLFVHLPLSENAPFILDYQLIAQAQMTGDTHLQQLHNDTPAKFQQQLLAPNTSIWCYTVDPNQ